MEPGKVNTERLRELRAIADSHGGVLKAEDVVNAARKENSPLHACFEWNDGAAAEKYRLEQARGLIRVTVIYQPKLEREITAFVSLKDERYEGDGGYRYVPELAKTQSGRDAMIETALWELEMFQKKYASIRKFAALFKEVRKLLKK